MTVHGAKGLEAPVVFLPDTMRKPQARDPLVWLEEEGADGQVGTTGGPALPPAGQAGRTRSHAKPAPAPVRRRRRNTGGLLYVAMTRAEDRLYVCGWQGRDTPPEDCWYALVRAGMKGLDWVETLAMPGGMGLVYAEPQTAPLPPPAEPEARRRRTSAAAARASHIARRRAAGAPAARAFSRLAGARAPLADRWRREPRPPARHRGAQVVGTSAGSAPADRPAAARRLLKSSSLDDGEREALAESMIELVVDPAFAALFAPDALAEAPISAVVGDRVITGQIDRLLVGEREVIALDYKTGRAPADGEAVPEAYRVQMESYRAALAAVFPERKIVCGLLFVDAPRLIWLSANE